MLDRLALEMRHVARTGASEALPPIPARNRDVIAKVAATRFPGFGAYNRAAQLTSEIGRSALVVGNATLDIATIADHLHAAAWLWRNASQQAGLEYLEESHREHWGEAMRALQLYLHVRQVRSAREPG